MLGLSSIDAIKRSESATKIQRMVRGAISRLKLDALKRQEFTCPIEHDTIDVHNSTLTKCGHIFDKQSLSIWCQKETVSKPSVDCPSCRKDIISINTKLLLFARDGDDILDAVKRGANMNAADNIGHTALHFAAQNGHFDTIRVLAESGADVNTPNNYGCTPVWIAAEKGHAHAIRMLKECGADVNAPRKWKRKVIHQINRRIPRSFTRIVMDGCTPVWIAAQNGHVDAIRVLAESGADVNTPNKIVETPVYIAAQNGHFDTIRVLAESGADVNTPNSYGCTPVYVAAQNGHFDTIRVLAESGADVNTPNSYGCTPVYVATKKGHQDVVNVLREYGAKDPNGCGCIIS